MSKLLLGSSLFCAGAVMLSGWVLGTDVIPQINKGMENNGISNAKNIEESSVIKVNV